MNVNSRMTNTENQLAKMILDAAFKVHTKSGPGLLETVYEVLSESSGGGGCASNSVKRIVGYVWLSTGFGSARLRSSSKADSPAGY